MSISCQNQDFQDFQDLPDFQDFILILTRSELHIIGHEQKAKTALTAAGLAAFQRTGINYPGSFRYLVLLDGICNPDLIEPWNLQSKL